MQPPELRLYSRAELLELLEKDISNIVDEKQKHLAGSEESWWHLCSADPTFPFYIIPTKEFVVALAAYLASRVKRIRSDTGGTASNCSKCQCSKARAPAAGESSSSCCNHWDSNRPITILECGAGTGIMAAHLLPLLHQHLQPVQQQPGPLQQQQQLQQEAPDTEQTGRAKSLFNEQDYKAARSKMHDDCNSLGAPILSAGSNSPKTGKPALPVFAYVASEPRTELQWCPTALAASRDGCRLAMERHCPQLVICCWMPFNVDWTEKARASCCGCCRCMRRQSCATELQHHHSRCQVQEYILIGHAEGGLVGRPLETWGMSCSEANHLPLGVDYEVPQALPQGQQRSAPCSPSEETSCPGTDEKAVKELSNEKKGGRKRRRGSEDEDYKGRNGREWKSANSFRSIPPDAPAAEEVAAQAIGGDTQSLNCATPTEQQLVGDFGGVGQELLPLRSRPYYVEGFVRLPPLPAEKDAETEMGEQIECGLLKELQRAQPLSRFDSLHSLLAGVPSTSPIVVFRRKRSQGDI
ncbi:hypothetical protein, conserved [Eimeria praecox]|uniref:Uncharacterized protein n=1 Tax=Eimeria praecox TaxID=51316 RepID=U6GC70_9EIME|nr:hypothetical protein, conserved [Eimeria praecox]